MSEIQVILNQDPEYKKKLSDTAIKTSSRPEILEQRTLKLQQWRDEHPEDFYNKCIKKMHNTWHSKPEKILFQLLLKIDDFNFKRNQCIKSDFFDWKSQRKQIDIADKQKRIYIEYDGLLHFENIFGEEHLLKIKYRDYLLEKYISKHHWTLIRISDDQFIDKTVVKNSKFKPECISKLIEILQAQIPGIYKIGKRYE